MLVLGWGKKQTKLWILLQSMQKALNLCVPSSLALLSLKVDRSAPVEFFARALHHQLSSQLLTYGALVYNWVDHRRNSLFLFLPLWFPLNQKPLHLFIHGPPSPLFPQPIIHPQWIPVCHGALPGSTSQKLWTFQSRTRPAKAFVIADPIISFQNKTFCLLAVL